MNETPGPGGEEDQDRSRVATHCSSLWEVQINRCHYIPVLRASKLCYYELLQKNNFLQSFYQ